MSTMPPPLPEGFSLIKSDYDDEVRSAAQKYGVDPEFAVAIHKSEYDPKRWSSSAGARGPMQLMPGTAKDLGVNPDDPNQNIDGGVRYLRDMLNRFDGDPELASAAYNSGPEAVKKHGGVPPYKETQGYVKKVLGFLGPSEAQAADKPPPPLPPGFKLEEGKGFPEGFEYKGNVNLFNRPKVKNPKGGTSTVYSKSFGINGKEVLMPTVSDDGRLMSDDEAVQQYKKTGKHLGIYDTVAEANAAGEAIHKQQESLAKDKNKFGGMPPLPPGFKLEGKKQEEPSLYETFVNTSNKATATLLSKMASLGIAAMPDAILPSNLRGKKRAQIEEEFMAEAMPGYKNIKKPTTLSGTLVAAAASAPQQLMELAAFSKVAGGITGTIGAAKTGASLLEKVVRAYPQLAVTFGLKGATETKEPLKQAAIGAAEAVPFAALGPFGWVTRLTGGGLVGYASVALTDPDATPQEKATGAIVNAAFMLASGHGGEARGSRTQSLKELMDGGLTKQQAETVYDHTKGKVSTEDALEALGATKEEAKTISEKILVFKDAEESAQVFEKEFAEQDKVAKSPVGAEGLRQQLTEEEATTSPTPAEASAQVLGPADVAQERIRQSPQSADLLRQQLAQDEAKSKLRQPPEPSDAKPTVTPPTTLESQAGLKSTVPSPQEVPEPEAPVKPEAQRLAEEANARRKTAIAAMTKEELVAYGIEKGVPKVSAKKTKETIKAYIRAFESAAEEPKAEEPVTPEKAEVPPEPPWMGKVTYSNPDLEIVRRTREQFKKDWEASGKKEGIHYDTKLNKVMFEESESDTTLSHEIAHSYTEEPGVKGVLWEVVIRDVDGAGDELAQWATGKQNRGRIGMERKGNRINDDPSNPGNYDWKEHAADLVAGYLRGDLPPKLTQVVENVGESFPDKRIGKLVDYTRKQTSEAREAPPKLPVPPSGEKVTESEKPKQETAKEPWEMSPDELAEEKGYKIGSLPGEDIARAEPDGTILLDREKFFGHGPRERRDIIEHERSHFVEERIKPEDKAKYFDVPSVMNYRGRNINEKLANMIQDGKLPHEVLADYPDLAKKNEPEPLRPAVRVQTGSDKKGTPQYSQYEGEPGQSHDELLEDMGITPRKTDVRGFVVGDGEDFLSRGKATKWLKENDPETFKKWRAGVGPNDLLHTEAYAEAKGLKESKPATAIPDSIKEFADGVNWDSRDSVKGWLAYLHQDWDKDIADLNQGRKPLLGADNAKGASSAIEALTDRLKQLKSKPAPEGEPPATGVSQQPSIEKRLNTLYDQLGRWNRSRAPKKAGVVREIKKGIGELEKQLKANPEPEATVEKPSKFDQWQKRTEADRLKARSEADAEAATKKKNEEEAAAREGEREKRLEGQAEKTKPPERTEPLGSVDRIQAKKRPDGKWQLFYQGTRNEIFPGEFFKSANEARNYFKTELAKQKEAQSPYRTPADVPKDDIGTDKDPWKNERGFVALPGRDWFKSVKDWMEGKETDEEKAFSSVGKMPWVGSRNIATVKAYADSLNHQDRLMEAVGEKKFGPESKRWDYAIQIYRDLKRSPGDVQKYWNQLTDAQKKVVRDAQAIDQNPTLKAIAEKQQAENDAIGELAKDAKVIRNFLDDHANRIWGRDPIKLEKGESGRRFGTTTRHAKERVYNTIVEGWAEEEDLAVRSSIESLRILKEELSNTIADKNFMKWGRGYKIAWPDPKNPTGPGTMEKMFSAKHLDGYKLLEHPNFKDWERVGNFKDKGDVYFSETGLEYQGRKDMYVTDNGDVMRRVELYAPKEVANRINKMTMPSVLNKIPLVPELTALQGRIKYSILTTSLFHPQAFIRSILLGTPREFAKTWNPNEASRMGIQAIKNYDPVLMHIAENGGLTFARQMDWEAKIMEKHNSGITRLLNKIGGPNTEIGTKIVNFNKSYHDWLFGKYGAGQKAMFAIAEYQKAMKEHPNMDPNTMAVMVGTMANDNFGGMNLMMKERGATQQHLFRLFSLAPDWTESNIDMAARAFGWKTKGMPAPDAKTQAKFFADFWGTVLTRAMIATVGANAIMSLADDRSFLQRYKDAWKDGNLQWLDVDVTPLAQWLGAKEGTHKYFRVAGHFLDPLRMVSNPTKFLSDKGSPLYRFWNSLVTAKNWKNETFTTVPELLGLTGDSEKAPLAGRFTKPAGKHDRGPVSLAQAPSFLADQVRGSIPIPLQNMASFFSGELDAFDSLSHGGGLLTRSTKATTGFQDFLMEHRPDYTGTPKQIEEAKTKNQIMELGWTGKTQEFESKVQEKLASKAITTKQAGEWRKEQAEGKLNHQIGNVPLPILLQGWQMASDQEKLQIKDKVEQKIKNYAKDEEKWDEVKDLANPVANEIAAMSGKSEPITKTDPSILINNAISAGRAGDRKKAVSILKSGLEREVITEKEADKAVERYKTPVEVEKFVRSGFDKAMESYIVADAKFQAAMGPAMAKKYWKFREDHPGQWKRMDQTKLVNLLKLLQKYDTGDEDDEE